MRSSCACKSQPGIGVVSACSIGCCALKHECHPVLGLGGLYQTPGVFAALCAALRQYANKRKGAECVYGLINSAGCIAWPKSLPTDKIRLYGVEARVAVAGCGQSMFLLCWEHCHYDFGHETELTASRQHQLLASGPDWGISALHTMRKPCAGSSSPRKLSNLSCSNLQ